LKENLITRKQYKEIKKYDRQQMEIFLTNIYKDGFQDGVNAGDNADFKIKLVQVLQNTKGVGEKTIEKVLDTLKEMEV
jgi:hypothetical protein